MRLELGRVQVLELIENGVLDDFDVEILDFVAPIEARKRQSGKAPLVYE